MVSNTYLCYRKQNNRRSMFTNKEEVLENALRVFAKMNYEKASQMEIAKACGLSKAGLTCLLQ